MHQLTRNISVSCISHERFGTSEGGSGWSWDKGGIGMGGKEAGIKQNLSGIGKIAYKKFIGIISVKLAIHDAA